MTITNQNPAFNVLNESELINISGGCVTETLSEHPFKTIFFGTIYIISVIYNCNN